MFIPVITKPTRVCERSATLIDNIFTNCCNFNDCLSGIMCTDISDHFPVFLIDFRIRCVTKDEHVTRRVYSQRNIAKFNEKLANYNWQNVFLAQDPEEAYTMFYRQLVTDYDSCFPLRTFRGTYSNRIPWLSDDLRELIKRKNILMSKSKKHPYSLKIKYEYQKHQRLVQKSIRNAEREHYNNLFEQHKCDLVKSWKIIKQIINRNKSKKIPRYFMINDKQVDDKFEIASKFNEFYVNLGPSLASKIPDVGGNPLSYMTTHTYTNIFFYQLLLRKK